jgi:hypothetical protein
MRDRNPAQTTKICNKCGKVGLRQYISFKFIQNYGVYCTECNYKSEASPSEMHGIQEWSNAKELKETPEQMITRINESLRGK